MLVMTMAMATMRETKRIDGVDSIKVTEIVEDGDGSFVRAIRFYSSVTGDPPLLEVIVSSPERRRVAITTPELEF
jgi:hypothetical protein